MVGRAVRPPPAPLRTFPPDFPSQCRFPRSLTPPEDLFLQPIKTPIAPVTMVSEPYTREFQKLIGLFMLDRFFNLPAHRVTKRIDIRIFPASPAQNPWYSGYLSTICGTPTVVQPDAEPAVPPTSCFPTNNVRGQRKFSLFSTNAAAMSQARMLR